MFPLWTLLKWLVQIVPTVMFDPSRAGVFWGIVFLVAMQYRRVAATERAIYGEPRTSVWTQTAVSLGQGLIGGLIGSLLIVFLGITITGAGLIYLLPVALLLMLINPRYLCFSYAGGLLSLSFLLFGLPVISVPGLIGLVAALHATESLLILLSGSGFAVALSLRMRRGTVAGFSLQKFWPVPIAVLWIATGAPGDGIAMPEWWPLIRPSLDMIEQSPELVYHLLPVVAVLGYSDLAISSRPESKARQTAAWLMVYSIVLMILAVAASRQPLMMWPAALFAPLGHELVIRIGNRRELSRPPWLSAPQEGVRVLDTVPRTAAARLGLRRSDVITHVNGEPAVDSAELARLLNDSVFGAEITVVRGERKLSFITRRRPEGGRWGLITVPEPWQPGLVELRTGGALASAVRRWTTRRRRHREDM